MGNPRHLQRILDQGLIAVVRADRSEQLVSVSEALLAGGVDLVEITFTVPKPVQVLEQVVAKLGSKMLVGAGTVLDAETARAAILAGADFIVSPTVSLEVIEMCRRYDKLVFTGALTPTEVITAWQAGADIVKIFPSELTGPGYLKVLRGPLPQVRMMPTGGVTLENAAEFLKCGACALGVGGAMVDTKAIAAGDMQKIEGLARQFVQIVTETRLKLSKPA